MWKTIRIADFGSVITGKTPSSNNLEHFGDDYPFITPTDMGTGRIVHTDRGISQEGYLKLRRQILPRWSVCFVCIGATIGKICLTTKKSLTNQQINSVVVDTTRHNPFFVYYLLSTYAEAVKSIAGGAATPIVNKTSFENIEVVVPPLPTQHKIAAILSAYDDLIENNMRRIKILEEMAQNLYREWFVKFRFPGHQHTRFIDSPLGRIPEGWAVANFGELYMTSSGGTPSRKVSEYYGGAHPWVKTRELNDGFIFETEETVTDLGLKKSSAKSFPANTVILAIYGATIGKLGILSISSATNQACVAILPKEEGFGRAFSFLFLRENRDKLISLGQGAAQQNISQVVLKNFPALRPPESLMHEFSQMVEPLLDNDRNLQQKNIILRRTRDLLLPRLISGDVDVSELDIPVPKKADE